MYLQQLLFDLWRSDIINLPVVEDIEKSIISSLKNQFIALWNLLTYSLKKSIAVGCRKRGFTDASLTFNLEPSSEKPRFFLVMNPAPLAFS